MKIISCDRRRIKREMRKQKNYIYHDSYEDFPVMLGDDFILTQRGMFEILMLLYIRKSVTDLIDKIFIENKRETYKTLVPGYCQNISVSKKREKYDVTNEITSRFLNMRRLLVTFKNVSDKTKFTLMI